MAKKYTDISTGTPYEDNVILVANATTGALRRVTVAQLLAATGTDPGGGSAPTVVSATCPNGAANTVVVVFSQSMTAVTTAGWSFKKNGSAWSVSSVTGATTTWTFTMGSSAISTDTLLRSYDSTTGATIGTSLELVSFTDSAVTNSVAGYQTETNTYLASNTGLSGTQEDKIDALVVALKAIGWSKFQAVYIPIYASAAANKWNLVNPADTDGAFRLTFAGSGVTHAADGIDFDGANGFADTKFTPSTHLADVDSVHVSFYSKDDIAGSNTYDTGAIRNSGGVFRLGMKIKNVSGNFEAFLNNNGSVSVAVADSSGLFTMVRTGANDVKGYRNATEIVTDAVNASSGLPNDSVLIGGASEDAVDYAQGTKKCAFFSIGTELTGGEVSALSSAVSTFLA